MSSLKFGKISSSYMMTEAIQQFGVTEKSQTLENSVYDGTERANMSVIRIKVETLSIPQGHTTFSPESSARATKKTKDRPT